MAAPIPSNLLFVSAGVDFLQSNPLNWVLQSDGVTPALRIPVVTDSVQYQDFPTDSLGGFTLEPLGYGFQIGGSGVIYFPSQATITLVAVGNVSLNGPSGGTDIEFLGTSPSARLIVSGGYVESGDGSGNIQNAIFSGNLNVETSGVTYDSIKVGGNFVTNNGDSRITNMEVVGTSFADDQGMNGNMGYSGIFHGLATTTWLTIGGLGTSAFSGTFLGGQALTSPPGYDSTLYDQQYIDSQITRNHATERNRLQV